MHCKKFTQIAKNAGYIEILGSRGIQFDSSHLDYYLHQLKDVP